MTRNITAILSKEMRTRLYAASKSLRTILAAFWSGTVQWTAPAQEELDFWKSISFENLSAPISADVLGKEAELVFDYPALVNDDEVSVLFQDASAAAAGGGILHKEGWQWGLSGAMFLSKFSLEESHWSSTLREILGVWRCLNATQRKTKLKILFACDN